MTRLFILLMLLASAAQGQTEADCATMLQQRLQGQLLFLRGFYIDSKITYDVNGNPLGSPKPGSWTTARMLVKAVTARPGEVVIEGERLGLYSARDGDKFATGRLKTGITLTLQIPTGTLPAVALAASTRIFLDESELEGAIPPPWEPQLAVAWVRGAALHRLGDPVPAPSHLQSQVQGIGGKVKAPRPLKTPDPEYDPFAKRINFQGISLLWMVVDPEGKPQEIRIVRPLGMGLDEKAVEAVRHWRFKPATRNGTPVAVKLSVEVSFRLQ